MGLGRGLGGIGTQHEGDCLPDVSCDEDIQTCLPGGQLTMFALQCNVFAWKFFFLRVITQN